jgi:RNA polymerase sigma factor (sigma-70 family)
MPEPTRTPVPPVVAPRHGLASSRPRHRMPPAVVARLADRAAAGDAHAWSTIVDEFAGIVWAATRAHRLNDADAADVVQTTFVRLVEHLNRLQRRDRLGAWLATTARRECLRVLRHRARVLPFGDELPEPCDQGPDHAAVLIDRERNATLWAAFERLPSRDQALLRMLIADPTPSYEEISAALAMPVGSIGPTRARALERLRGELERCRLELS